MNTYSANELHQMNYNPKYGSNWIKKSEEISSQTTEFKLYPTGDATISKGRIYVQLPANIKIDASIKEKYNII